MNDTSAFDRAIDSILDVVNYDIPLAEARAREV
jgi:hypothetical protein